MEPTITALNTSATHKPISVSRQEKKDETAE